MVRRVVAAVALVAAIAASCATSTSPTIESAPDDDAPASTASTTTSAPAPATSPGCDDPASSPVRSTHVDTSIDSSGTARTYELYVPSRYDGTPVPLILDLHGYLSGAAGQVAMSDLAADAESAGFILATPQGNGPLPYWNAAPHADLPDDVQFVADVIDDVGADLCIDAARVYVDGFSNGAFLASLIACRLADRVAAVATVAGLQFPADCDPARPIPILAFHGTADQYVAFDGGDGVALDALAWDEQSTRAFADLPFAPVTAALASWSSHEGCAMPAEQRQISASVELIRYDGCAEGSVLELYVISGAGHTWPGSDFARASEPILGPATSEIDANDLILEFFASHPMPP